VPLLEPTRGASSFDDEGALFITTEDDLCLFGVGEGDFRSSLPIGAECLISVARSDLGSEVGVGAPRSMGVEIWVCGERPGFDSEAMSVVGCVVCFLAVSEGRFSCGEIGFPCFGNFFSSVLGLPPSYDGPVVSSLGRSAEDTPAII